MCSVSDHGPHRPPRVASTSRLGILSYFSLVGIVTSVFLAGKPGLLCSQLYSIDVYQ